MNPMGLNRKPANDCLPDGTFDTTPRAIVRGGACLIGGNNMFRNIKEVTTILGDFANLTNGSGMFWGCNNATRHACSLPKLTNGNNMFDHNDMMTSWDGTLPSLMTGTSMFDFCYNLRAESIINIIASLPTYTSGTHAIGFRHVLALTQAHIDAAAAKGWTVQGTPIS